MPAYDADSFDSPAPVAFVKLRNPQNSRTVADIRMLIDSGADVTLIPMTAANQLALTAEPGEMVEVMGFDGGVTLVPVARLEMPFLNKTFRGQFLLIDQVWGVLGRDILNLVSLVLNGPESVWAEQPRGR